MKEIKEINLFNYVIIMIVFSIYAIINILLFHPGISLEREYADMFYLITGLVIFCLLVMWSNSIKIKKEKGNE